MPHHHLCSMCKTFKVPCDGTWERNHDGSPEVICDLHHIHGVECICDSCRARMAEEKDETPWAI